MDIDSESRSSRTGCGEAQVSLEAWTNFDHEGAVAAAGRASRPSNSRTEAKRSSSTAVDPIVDDIYWVLDRYHLGSPDPRAHLHSATWDVRVIERATQGSAASDRTYGGVDRLTSKKEAIDP